MCLFWSKLDLGAGPGLQLKCHVCDIEIFNPTISLPHRIGQNFRGHGFVHGFVNFEKGGPIPIHVGSYIVNPCNFLPSRIQNMKINVKSMSEYL